MSREIKFRAWIPKELESGEYEVEYEMCYDLAFEDYEPINDLLNNQKNLMQYTGFIDKDGVEIYESDIIKTDYGNMEVAFDNRKGCWSLCNQDFQMWSFNVDFTKKEVISNIFKNPELLINK